MSATIQKRADRRRADREFAKQAVEHLRSSEGWQRWLAVRARFRAHSHANQLLIAMQCQYATRVAGFRAWLQLGYCVRKGEKAIRIWAPCPPSKRQLAAWRAAGANPDDEPRTYFRLVAVFDRCQVDELPPPATPVSLDPPIEPVDGDSAGALIEPLVGLARMIGSEVTYRDLGADAGGFYDPRTKAIVLNETRAVNAQVKTLIHELGHALTRADRRPDDPQLDYASEELIVESVALTVCLAIGLDTSGYSIPYLATWSENADLAVIEQHATLVDRIAERIEDVLLAVPARVAA